MSYFVFWCGHSRDKNGSGWGEERVAARLEIRPGGGRFVYTAFGVGLGTYAPLSRHIPGI